VSLPKDIGRQGLTQLPNLQSSSLVNSNTGPVH